MKFLIPMLFLLSSTHVFAKSCKVYGISDSPQALTCEFGQEALQVSCQKGSYFLNSTKVEMAFHLETEEGASPLVFKTSGMTLTVIYQSAGKFLAELERGQETLGGNCR